MAVESQIAERLSPLTETAEQGAVVELTALEKRLLDEFQHDFPLSPAPFAEMARRLGTSEERVLYFLETLQERGLVSRVGPVFKPRRIGSSTLAAMSVSAAQMDKVAAYVNGYDEVNHNYERDNRLNLWFVVTAPDQERLEQVLTEIEAYSGVPVIRLPLVKAFHIDLGFPLWC